mmetsp:Transcript_34778/g.78554  ORF Transcript_34778/g.78554 Transcript_34778/m.78554 type:complete len:212 (-) Transcript_34778:944-1579(-)
MSAERGLNPGSKLVSLVLYEEFPPLVPDTHALNLRGRSENLPPLHPPQRAHSPHSVPYLYPASKPVHRPLVLDRRPCSPSDLYDPSTSVLPEEEQRGREACCLLCHHPLCLVAQPLPDDVPSSKRLQRDQRRALAVHLLQLHRHPERQSSSVSSERPLQPQHHADPPCQHQRWHSPLDPLPAREPPVDRLELDRCPPHALLPRYCQPLHLC